MLTSHEVAAYLARLGCEGAGAPGRRNLEELMLRQKPVGCVLYNKPYTELFREVRRTYGRLAELHT